MADFMPIDGLATRIYGTEIHHQRIYKAHLRSNRSPVHIRITRIYGTSRIYQQRGLRIQQGYLLPTVRCQKQLKAYQLESKVISSEEKGEKSRHIHTRTAVFSASFIVFSEEEKKSPPLLRLSSYTSYHESSKLSTDQACHSLC